MTEIRYAGRSYAALSGESVLETLERAGVEVPNACRSGVCQSCLMRARAGDVPPAAQAGLKDTLRSQGYFLACCARPESDMEVALADDDALGETAVRLDGIEMLSPSVMRVTLRPEAAFEYRRGQFVNLVREDGLRRSYSLAGCANAGDLLELHVRHIPDGAMSGWLMAGGGASGRLRVQGPHGNCFYVPGQRDQPMLLIGTGTGLAPLYGIVCDALAAGHTGPIHLYHGARTIDGLYLVERMRAMAEQYTNLHYTPCVLEESGMPAASAVGEVEVGGVDAVALGRHGDLKGWRSYFCGDPTLVTRMRKRAYLAGASLADIYADAFLPAAVPAPA
ncbi:2Fe-2S iron-sulfur cluster-binding protein [Acidihalobacter prosperus]|uniref:Oxygenase n=1 Tax=Acidihalobacter prosperus TaxID=160660 RepID=A0A1A6C2V3_9GAMM|nr:2Fe-2S iron-sulfur cluster-binding protein [Acidihalobacter prosperus]OBS08884.1 hypothetical protein Thpro_023134 [Acidihalobacter prosperus]